MTNIYPFVIMKLFVPNLLYHNKKEYLVFSGSSAMQAAFMHAFLNSQHIYKKNNKRYTNLLQNNIILTSFSYPKKSDDIITRVVINSSHSKEDLTLLANQIIKYR